MLQTRTTQLLLHSICCVMLCFLVSPTFEENNHVHLMPRDKEINCQTLLDEFANATSQFTVCAIKNSRPITLCENCVNSYINIGTTYGALDTFADINGTHCIDHLVNLDRLQIINTLYDNNHNLWNRAKCYECFQSDNGKLTPNKSHETTTFKSYYDQFQACVNQSGLNDTTLCPTCLGKYIVLNDYYTSISNENEKIGVCMDIVDLMNTTRGFWSVKCCKFRKHDEYIFIASTITVLIATISFYVVTKYCSVIKTTTVLQQRRFAASLSRGIDGHSIN